MTAETKIGNITTAMKVRMQNIEDIVSLLNGIKYSYNRDSSRIIFLLDID
jgi:hypothetical protein